MYYKLTSSLNFVFFGHVHTLRSKSCPLSKWGSVSPQNKPEFICISLILLDVKFFFYILDSVCRGGLVESYRFDWNMCVFEVCIL